MTNFSGLRAGVAACVSAMLAAGCALPPSLPPLGVTPPQNNVNTAMKMYKVAAAKRITEANAASITPGRPQALLRAVVSVEYWIDRQGNVVGAAIFRDNGDRAADTTALASLKRASPFPAPTGVLLDSSGRVRIIETWLFNNDGRFQLRSVAAPQIGDEE